MSAAYVDTSYVVGIAFDEPGTTGHMARLRSFETLMASNLLTAEFRSAQHREKRSGRPAFLDRVRWILPDRDLDAEIERVFAAGYLRGANCWHLATALYLAEHVGAITFLTVDKRQQAIARRLGFAT
jgi:predicted nucleic acid-binding protein